MRIVEDNNLDNTRRILLVVLRFNRYTCWANRVKQTNEQSWSMLEEIIFLPSNLILQSTSYVRSSAVLRLFSSIRAQ